MAIIDVVKWDGSLDQFVWRFPSENLRFGTQLVVKPGQTAIFVRGGRVLDCFDEGTHSLKSGNLPLLGGLIGMAFGGDTPFQAEVWFVNKISKLNNRFGTPAPLQLEDPKYGLIVPVRAFGSFGFKVIDSRLFLETLVGTARVFGADKIAEYFRGRLLASVAANVGGALGLKQISIIQLAAHLEVLSEHCREKVAVEFNKYGLELVSFFFESINVPDQDPSYLKLKQIKEKAAELNIIGRDIYQYDRSMDVLRTAAGNEGVAGSVMQAGLGLGVGAGLGGHLGQQMGHVARNLSAASGTSSPPVPPSEESRFFVLMNGRQLGPFPVEVFRQMIPAGALSLTSLVWCSGMSGWRAAADVPELASLFHGPSTSNLPPPPPS